MLRYAALFRQALPNLDTVHAVRCLFSFFKLDLSIVGGRPGTAHTLSTFGKSAGMAGKAASNVGCSAAAIGTRSNFRVLLEWFYGIGIH